MSTHNKGSVSGTHDYGSDTKVEKEAPPVEPVRALDVDISEEEKASLAEKQQTVDDAAKAVAEAVQIKQQADADYAKAVEEHAAAVKALEPVLDPTIHIKLWNGVDYTAVDASKLDIDRDGQGRLRGRTVLVGGRNYEHTDTDAAGVWCYRAQ